MRPTTSLTTALAGGAALVLLTACGGGSDEAAASPTATSTATTTAAAAAFCADAEAAFSGLDGVSEATDPATLPAIVAQASAQLSSVQPPAEIADSWGTLTAALAQAAADVQGLDVTTPEGQQAFTQAFAALETTGSAAQQQVSTYVAANCDLPTGGAAPTS